MNKADLIEVIAGQTGSTKVDAAKALDVIVAVSYTHLRAHET